MRRVFFILASCLGIASCASHTDPNYYTLMPIPEQVAHTPGGKPYILKSVYISGVIDRPQLVTRIGKEKIVLRDLDRWAEPLGPMIFGVLSQELLMRAPTGRASGHEDAEIQTISVSIDEFLAADDGQSHLRGRWQNPELTGQSVGRVVRRFELNEKLPSPSSADIVQGMNVLLSRLSDTILNSD